MIYFYRESNDFTDILTDPVIKKHIRTKLIFENHLILSFDDTEKEDYDQLQSYLSLKYGDSMISFDSIVPDRTPIIGKDYSPEPRKKTFH